MGLRRERSLEVSGSGVGSGWGGGGSSEWVSGRVPVTSVTGGVGSTGHLEQSVQSVTVNQSVVIGERAAG